MTQSNPQQSVLPDEWVVRIFEHMSFTYGSKFADLWGGLEAENVRAYWGQKLGGFSGEAIRSAIDSLDERPSAPTLPEFIALCRSAARREGPAAMALPPPEPLSRTAAEKRAAELGLKIEKLNSFAASTSWAVRLRTEYLSGRTLLPIQISMASEALGESWAFGKVEITQKAAA